jgi:transcriptional regulator of arginine metabolism
MNMNTKTKRARQLLLKELVGRTDAGDQSLILGEMRKRGIRTTQATISRDLREMGYVKVQIGPGASRYEVFDPAVRGGLGERLKVLFRSFVVDIKGTGQLLLVKTSPGNANGVASLIDSLRKEGILGTIAGDDTILVVAANERKRKDIEREFSSLL